MPSTKSRALLNFPARISVRLHRIVFSLVTSETYESCIGPYMILHSGCCGGSWDFHSILRV